MSLKTFFQTFFNFGSWFVLIIFIIIGIFTFSSNTSLFGSYHSYLVLSGSMEPTIHINDIIIIRQQSQYYPSDVITFSSENHLVTHRVVESSNKSGTYHYLTKGDANRSEDDGQVNQSQVQGKVVFVIPKLGNLVSFAQSPFGLITLILIPLLGFAVDLLFKSDNAQR